MTDKPYVNSMSTDDPTTDIEGVQGGYAHSATPTATINQVAHLSAGGTR